MELYTVKEDIRLFCVTARSFPYGIAGAFATLERLLPGRHNRVFFGLSRKNADGMVTYQAAASEAYRGEAAKYPGHTFVLPRGEYRGKTIPGWRTRENSVAQTFALLQADPRADTDFPCIEWYEDCDTVTCMVRVHSAKNETTGAMPFENKQHNTKTNELC